MYYLVGNWKMNQNKKEVIDFFTQIEESKAPTSLHLWIAPQLVHIPLAQNHTKSIKVGAQNCCYEKQGSFTGEVSVLALAELGLEFVIVGHSERRILFTEEEDKLKKKLELALEAGLKVIFCVGESLEQREQNMTASVISGQLSHIKEHPNLLIAYEPVWAIGTNQAATPAQAQEIHQLIREKFPQTPLLYGGSVKPENIESILSQKDIDGALIGGASLRVDDFKKMVAVVSNSLT